MSEWRRASAIAQYPGFNSYLETSGERMRFVLRATIEYVSEVPKLLAYIDCMGRILALPKRRSQDDEIDGDWAE